MVWLGWVGGRVRTRLWAGWRVWDVDCSGRAPLRRHVSPPPRTACTAASSRTRGRSASMCRPAPRTCGPRSSGGLARPLRRVLAPCAVKHSCAPVSSSAAPVAAPPRRPQWPQCAGSVGGQVQGATGDQRGPNVAAHVAGGERRGPNVAADTRTGLNVAAEVAGGSQRFPTLARKAKRKT